MAQQSSAGAKDFDNLWSNGLVGSSLNYSPFQGRLFMRVPYWMVDLERDHNLRELPSCLHLKVARTSLERPTLSKAARRRLRARADAAWGVESRGLGARV